MTMTARERLLTTLDHQEPDRVPCMMYLNIDLLAKIRKHYGLKTNEEVYQKLSFGGGWEGGDMGTFAELSPPRAWKPTPHDIQLEEMTGWPKDGMMGYTWCEEWGIERKIAKKLPGAEHAQFFFAKFPWEQFDEVEQVEEAEFPDLDALGRWDMTERLVKETKDKCIVWADLQHTLWAKAWALRGMHKFMEDLHKRPKMADAILDKLLDYWCDATDTFLDLGCDGVCLCEDLATNHSLFIPPAMWVKYFKQRYKTLFDRVKKRDGFIFFHSDGNITPIVEDLVDIGIDLLNPVQPECMDPFEIKRKYGDKITVSTGCSVQMTLPFGTVEDVKRESLYALKHLAPGGGFCYGTSHEARSEVPVENILALYDTMKKYGNYPMKIEGYFPLMT